MWTKQLKLIKRTQNIDKSVEKAKFDKKFIIYSTMDGLSNDAIDSPWG